MDCPLAACAFAFTACCFALCFVFACGLPLWDFGLAVEPSGAAATGAAAFTLPASCAACANEKEARPASNRATMIDLVWDMV